MSMAEKMDKELAAAPTLPVSMEQKQQPRAAALPTFLHVDVQVQLVNLWSLLNAVGSLAFGVAYYTAVYTIIATSNPGGHQASSWLLLPRGGGHRDPAAQVASAIVIGILLCSAPQAAAGAAALLLPCHRWRLRWAAAHAALALTVASHGMFYVVVLVLVVLRNEPDPGLFFKILGFAAIFSCAVVDFLGSLALLRGEWRANN